MNKLPAKRRGAFRIAAGKPRQNWYQLRSDIGVKERLGPTAL